MNQEEPKDSRCTPDTPEHSPPPSSTAEPLDHSMLSQHHVPPPVLTPESTAQRRKFEEGTQRLLSAYKETFRVAEGLPAVVWLPWGGKRGRHFLKMPYMRWFLEYFLAHHVHKSLNVLNREFHAIAAVSSDHDVNKWDREAVKLFLQSLPPPPYKRLAFTVFFVALLLALPLRSFGDVTHVFDLVGAIMKIDIGGVGKAFTAQEFWETVRAMFVFLLSFSVVTSLLTSTFVLKRVLFNLYPAAKERLGSTAAREHTFSVRGLYELEDQVFSDVGLRRPKETPFDLLLRAFVLMLLLLLSVFLGSLTLFTALVAATPRDLIAEVGGTVTVSWYGVLIAAFFTNVFFVAFVIGLKRLLPAWRRRTKSVSN